MATPITNFGKVFASTGYTSAATSIVLATGHGSRLPNTFPYPLIWWNATDYLDPADDPDREIVQVTNRSGDTLTIVRGHEGTVASNKNLAGKRYLLVLSLTKGMIEELQDRALSESFRGLFVQTHPDSDVDDRKVIFSAESIVMDDGTQIADWSNVVVDLSASGANGLDTGSEINSKWYELYAISDGTNKAGLFHRSKDRDTGYFYTSGEDGGHALRDASARTKLAQGFKHGTASGPVLMVDAKLVKTGAPTGNVWFTLESNNGGVPSGTVLATSEKFDVSRIPTSAITLRFVFPVPYSISAATQYHFVLQGDYTISGANYISWRADTTAASYADGSKAAYDGATWTADADDDFIFYFFMEANDTAVTLPSGYTRKAKIGYVYNNAASNLRHFMQKDRRVFCGYDDDWQIGAFTNTAPALVYLQMYLPPVPLDVLFLIFNGTAANFAIGDRRASDANVTITDERIGITRGVANANNVIGAEIIIDKYQAVLFCTNGGTANMYVGEFIW